MPQISQFRKDDISLKLRDSIRVMKEENTILIYGGTAKIVRITGEKTEALSEILSIFKSPKKSSDALASLKHLLQEEEYDEIIQALRKINVLEEVISEEDLSFKEQGRYRLQVNYYGEFYDLKANLEFLRNVKNSRILVYGAEILGSKVIESLILYGFGKLVIVPQRMEVDADETYNSSFYSEEDIGKSKEQVIKNKGSRINPLVEVNVLRKRNGQLVEHLGEFDLILVCLDVPDPDEYKRINRECLLNNVAWLICGYLRGEIFIGPTFIPNQTACYNCFDKRVKGNLQYFDEYLNLEKSLVGNHRMQTGLAACFEVASGYITTEVPKLVPFLKKGYEDLLRRRKSALNTEEYLSLQWHLKYALPETLENQVIISLSPFVITKHPVLRLPRCEVCGISREDPPLVNPWDDNPL